MTPRERTWLIAGAGVIGIAFITRAAFAGVTAITDRVHVVAESRALLARAQALTRRAPHLRDSIARRGDEMVALAPMLVPGKSAAEARANLSAQITGWALIHRVAIQRLDAAPDSLAGSLVRMELVVRAEGDLAGFGRLIAEIEHSAMVLSLSRLSIASEGDPDAEPQRLKADFAVRGWMLK